jgi:thioredoxin 1
MELINKNKLKELENSDKESIVMFSTEWCGECKMNTLLLEDFQLNYKDVDFYKIDVDEQKLWAEEDSDYQILSVPTFFVYKNKQKVSEHHGFITELKLKELLETNEV